MQDDNRIEFFGALAASHDLISTMVWTTIALASVIFLPDGNVARIIMGIPMISLLPGYCLVSAIWPKSDGKKWGPSNISTIERLTLGVGLSFAVLGISSLVLNQTESGITLESTMAVSTAFIFATVFIGLLRRGALPAENRFSITIMKSGEPAIGEPVDKVVAVGVVFCVVTSVAILAYALATPGAMGEYSEFYILSENGSAADYPTNLTTNHTAAVIVGIVCHEKGGAEYTITVGIDNSTSVTTLDTWGDAVILRNGTQFSRTVHVAAGERYEDVFSFEMQKPGIYIIHWWLQVDGVTDGYESTLKVVVHGS